MNTDDPQADLVAAALFIVTGFGAVWIALDYPLGTLRRLGPGAMPMGVGVLLILSGFGLGLQTLLRLRYEGPLTKPVLLGWFKWPKRHVLRATFSIVAGLCAFGLLVRPSGLFLATAVLVFLSSRAEAGTPILGSILLALVIPAMCVGIFVYGIGLPFRVWP